MSPDFGGQHGLVEVAQALAVGQARLFEQPGHAPLPAFLRLALAEVEQELPVSPVVGLRALERRGVDPRHGGQVEAAQQPRQRVMRHGPPPRPAGRHTRPGPRPVPPASPPGTDTGTAARSPCATAAILRPHVHPAERTPRRRNVLPPRQQSVVKLPQLVSTSPPPPPVNPARLLKQALRAVPSAQVPWNQPVVNRSAAPNAKSSSGAEQVYVNLFPSTRRAAMANGSQSGRLPIEGNGARRPSIHRLPNCSCQMFLIDPR